MLSKNLKRLLVIIISLIISAYIWHVNDNIFGNPYHVCLNLSTTTFLIVFTPFEIYFSFRDMWFKRWMPLNLKELEILKLKIEINKKSKKQKAYLHADLITPKDQGVIKLKNILIVICHGFSDTKNTLQYYYLPLVCNGYTILAYDARGIGESKKTGRRNQFLERIEDFKKVIEWVRSNKDLNQMEIYCVGFSIGAITVLCGGFPNRDIKKIIAISSISNYKQNIPKYNPLILLSYFIKGVKLFPNLNENMKVSPYFVMDQVKNTHSIEEWRIFSQRVMLIHARNDRIIKLKNFSQNKLLLETLDKHKLILKKGGHSQKKNELALVGATMSFFNS
ncbi:MAG: alpha/beta hydrolase family protein [Promethearchaeota archaeon]